MKRRTHKRRRAKRFKDRSLSSLKDKSIVIVLIVLLGPLGIHRMYLGQNKRGFIYMLLTLTGISFFLAFFDFFYFLFMDQKKFDLKYNKLVREEERTRPKVSKQQLLNKRANTKNSRDLKALKIKGKELFTDYHIEDAVEIYQNILTDNPEDIVSHFNLACSFSILENAELSYEHLEKAVSLGFDDYSKILEHEALAYMRLDDGWDDFVSCGFRQPENCEEGASFNLIKELKRITELRDMGIIDDLQFNNSKLKLLRE